MDKIYILTAVRSSFTGAQRATNRMADINSEIYLTQFCIDVNIYEFRSGGSRTQQEIHINISSALGLQQNERLRAIRLQCLSENIKEIQKSIYKRT